jgi:geranylgeranyl diphosphate synthase type I
VAAADIEQMYHLKTTRYTFEAPLVMGGLLAGASEATLQDLAALIAPVGLAFQIQNDLIEYQKFKGVERTGLRDILEGKKTLLLRLAFDRLEDLDRSFLQLCLSTRASSEAALTKIEQLIDKSGAVDELSCRRDALFQESEAALVTSSLDLTQRDGLREVLALIRQQTQHTGTQ